MLNSTHAPHEKGRGPRHTQKRNRWQITTHDEPRMIGRWLDEVAAKRALRDGFYEDGTIIKVFPSSKYFFVYKRKLHECDRQGELLDN